MSFIETTLPPGYGIETLWNWDERCTLFSVFSTIYCDANGRPQNRRAVASEKEARRLAWRRWTAAVLRGRKIEWEAWDDSIENPTSSRRGQCCRLRVSEFRVIQYWALSDGSEGCFGDGFEIIDEVSGNDVDEIMARFAALVLALEGMR